MERRSDIASDPAVRPARALGSGALARLGRACGGILVAMYAVGMMTGCAGNERMRASIDAYSHGAYPLAAEQVTHELDAAAQDRTDGLLIELEAGMILAAAGEGGRSSDAFRSADEAMWQYLDSEPEVRISEITAALLTNQTVIPYRGTATDRIMCSVYQALNFMADGNLEAAGVSLRRSYEWQRDAVERRAKEIENLESEARAHGERKGYDLSRALDDPRTRSDLDSAYGPIREMQAYADYAIPYASYLQGLQQMMTGRADAASQATVAFRKVAGMLPESDRGPVETDAREAEDASIGKRPAPTVHIILESGMAPSLHEFRISVPIYSRSVPYVGAAFPVLHLEQPGPSGFSVVSGGSRAEASLLTDMDRVIAADLNARLPAIIALTVASSGAKAVATYFLQDAARNTSKDAAIAVAIGGLIYQAVVNHADLRIWRTLPKRVYLARIAAPESGMLTIELEDGQRIGPIAVESDGATVVHLRVPGRGATPAVRTMRFPR